MNKHHFNNQRTFLRLKTRLPSRCCLCSDHEGKEPIGQEHVGIILDIGGGGVKLMTEEHLMKNELIRLHISLPTLPFGGIDVVGRVVAVERSENGPFARICFLSISPEHEQAIVRYIISIKTQPGYKE
jgi:c-di-GMP-binding flagellar brake protein YcgR